MAFPESSLIRQEHVIRDLQFTNEVKLTRRSLARWLSLSLGLIAPNESRTLMLDLIDSLFYFHYNQEEPDINMIVTKVKELRKSSGEKGSGAKGAKGKDGKVMVLDEETRIAKAVRYHLLVLKKRGILERHSGKYRFVLSPLIEDRDLGKSLEYAYTQNHEIIFEKIKKAFTQLSRSY
jgi:hypothetical protein